MQSVSITTNVVSSNPVHVEVHRIQHYVIKLISDFWQVGGFLWLIHQQNWPPWCNWNIVENTITLTLTLILQFYDWILKLFGQCCIFVLHFFKTFMFPCIWWIKIQNVYWLLIIDFNLYIRVIVDFVPDMDLTDSYRVLHLLRIYW